MNNDRLKEKFSRIFKKGGKGPRFLDKLDFIYETVKQSKTHLKIKEIADITKIKENTVRRYLSYYLEKHHYVQKTRKYTPPFLMVTPINGDPEFIYGKDNRIQRQNQEKKDLIIQLGKLNLSNDLANKLNTLKSSIDYTGLIFKIHNELVDYAWINNIKSVSKMNIGSGANRYKL